MSSHVSDTYVSENARCALGDECVRLHLELLLTDGLLGLSAEGSVEVRVRFDAGVL